MPLAKARNLAKGKAKKPSSAVLSYGEEPMTFREPRSSDAVMPPELLTLAANDYPKLDAGKAYSAFILSRCYLRDEEEEKLEDEEIFLFFCGIANDDDFGFADLDIAFAEAFPDFGKWILERVKLAKAKGESPKK